MASGPAAHTFLFADLAGFTALTEAHGDEEAASLVVDFCGRARALLPEYGGEEVKSIGDALMLRVPSAADAVGLARRLAQEVGGHHGFPAVRVGLHTGPAVERDRDWFGSTVNLAARICSAAPAGEVLVSAATRDAALQDAPELNFTARGRQRFKNVSSAVEVYSVGFGGQAERRALTIDPVCRMAVDPARAGARREHDGHEYCFCSEACACTFDESPQELVARPSSELRASDRSRERAAKLLRSAYSRGRLTADELEERVEHVHAARTRAELRRVLKDLPEYRRWRKAARRRRFWLALLPRRLRRRWSSPR